jgi:hypothetical protein
VSSLGEIVIASQPTASAAHHAFIIAWESPVAGTCLSTSWT